jgi:hypothetical protein
MNFYSTLYVVFISIVSRRTIEIFVVWFSQM